MKMELKSKKPFLIAYATYLSARNAFNGAQQECDHEAQVIVPQAGYGKDAMVRHVHADANFGHQCPDLVVSRVVNAFGRNGEIMLRVQLGKVKGPLSLRHASLKLADVKELVTPSKEAYYL
jgi:hypothetical protein